MQKLSGRGKAFVEIDGSAVEYELKAGEKMVVDSGNLAMMDATCSIDIQTVKGVKNVLFGGEGLFNTVVTGPGRIVLQTMPINKFCGGGGVCPAQQQVNKEQKNRSPRPLSPEERFFLLTGVRRLPD